MRLHTPFFIFGILILVVPFVGLPLFFERIIFVSLGISIVFLSSTKKFIDEEYKNLFVRFSDEKKEDFVLNKKNENKFEYEKEIKNPINLENKKSNTNVTAYDMITKESNSLNSDNYSLKSVENFDLGKEISKVKKPRKPRVKKIKIQNLVDESILDSENKTVEDMIFKIENEEIKNV